MSESHQLPVVQLQSEDFASKAIRMNVKEEIIPEEGELGEEFIIPNIPPTQTKDVNEFYVDLLQCEEDCQTCLKYMRILSEHVRVTHAPPHQPIQDPLFVDPLQVDLDPPNSDSDLSSFVEIKFEPDEDIVKVEYCEEELKNYVYNTDVEIESRSEIDPDYNPSTRLTRKDRCRGFQKNHTLNDSRTLSVTKPFKCNECDKNLKSKGKLEIHKRIHTGEKPFQCELCEKCFARSDSLILHKRYHTGEKPHKCDQCEKCFTQKCNLIEHKRTHNSEKPFKCEECEKSFSLHSSLRIHKMFHTGERPHQCDECEKCFTKLNNLTIHKKTHTGERPFKCDVCERSFTRSNILAEHKRIHTGEIAYECDECGKSFTQKNSLTAHKKTHTGEKPFKCDVCMKSFSRNSHLNRHMRVHTE